jgi:hypothetical protein
MFRRREVTFELALEQFKKEYTDYTYWKRNFISYVIYSQYVTFF